MIRSVPYANTTVSSSRLSTAIGVLVVLLVALILYGAPVPRLSEELYLPLARHTADPTYLAGDWTMAGPFGEHWAFDHFFGPLASWFPLPWFGWIGRLVTWSVLALLLVRLGERFGLKPGAAAVGVSLWLVANQSLMGSDWMLGTFEAKTVAYCLLVGGLLAATGRRVPLAIALLGLTITIHPGLGIWAALAGGSALLADPATRRTALRWSVLGVLLAAPGIVGAFDTLRATSEAMQRFVVLHAIPHHADPFFGGSRLEGLQVVLRVAALVGMLIANIVWFRRSTRDQPARFLIAFQLVAFTPVVVAFGARALGSWGFLLVQPLRLGPVIIPLLFFLHLVARCVELRRGEDRGGSRLRQPSVRLATAGVVLALFVTSPVLASPRMIARTVKAWVSPDEEAAAFRWIRDHTPSNTRCVVPVDRQDAFMRTERPVVATWQGIRYDALESWKHRIDSLVGGSAVLDRSPGDGDELTVLRAEYDQLSAHEIATVARRYDANCIVSTASYPFAVLHRNGDVRVYRAPPGASG